MQPRSIDFARRQFLHSSLGLGAFLLPRVASAADGNAPARREKSVIVLLLEGGMSHIETWDPKPNGPSAIRGEYQPIRTSNPDLIIGEHMPLLAQQAHRYNVIRSVHSALEITAPGYIGRSPDTTTRQPVSTGSWLMHTLRWDRLLHTNLVR